MLSVIKQLLNSESSTESVYLAYPVPEMAPSRVATERIWHRRRAVPIARFVLFYYLSMYILLFLCVQQSKRGRQRHDENSR